MELLKKAMGYYLDELKIDEPDVVLVVKSQFEKILKKLEALDIIIKKNVNVLQLVDMIKNYDDKAKEKYNWLRDKTALTEEEIEILRNVLDQYKEYFSNEFI